MTEARLTRKIQDKLKYEGAFVAKISASGPHQQSGLPDLVGCYAGAFFGLEVKVPGREHTLTPKQAMKLRKIKRAGGIAKVVTSKDDVQGILDECAKKTKART